MVSLMQPKSTAVALNVKLFAAALTDPAQRTRARAQLLAALANGGVSDLRLRYGPTSVHLLTAAAQNGWEEAVGDLLAAGADVHLWDDAPLQWSAMRGHLSVVEHLLAAGADACAKDGAALMWAAKNGHLSVVERLLAAGADVHAGHERALRAALKGGNIPLARRLLAHGADAACAWEWMEAPFRSSTAAVLEHLAADIPPVQRRSLLRTAQRWFPITAAPPHCGFPAMQALESAALRRTGDHRTPSRCGHRTP